MTFVRHITFDVFIIPGKHILRQTFSSIRTPLIVLYWSEVMYPSVECRRTPSIVRFHRGKKRSSRFIM
jgi:hypothetical protein